MVEPTWPNIVVEDVAYFGVQVPTPFVREMIRKTSEWGPLLKPWLLTGEGEESQRMHHAVA